MSSLQREDPSPLGQGLCDDPISLPACFHHRTESQAAPVGFSSCLHPLSTPGEQVPAQYCSLAGPGCRSRGHRQEALGSWGCFALRRPIACPGFPENWALLKASRGFPLPKSTTTSTGGRGRSPHETWGILTQKGPSLSFKMLHLCGLEILVILALNLCYINAVPWATAYRLSSHSPTSCLLGGWVPTSAAKVHSSNLETPRSRSLIVRSSRGGGEGRKAPAQAEQPLKTRPARAGAGSPNAPRMAGGLVEPGACAAVLGLLETGRAPGALYRRLGWSCWAPFIFLFP